MLLLEDRSVLGRENVPGLVASTATAVAWVFLQSFGIVLLCLCGCQVPSFSCYQTWAAAVCCEMLVRCLLEYWLWVARVGHGERQARK